MKVSENRVLRILAPKLEEVARGWRRLHNERLCKLNASPSVIKGMKSRRVKWAGHVTRNAKMEKRYKALVGKPEGKNYSEDLDVEGKYLNVS